MQARQLRIQVGDAIAAGFATLTAGLAAAGPHASTSSATPQSKWRRAAAQGRARSGASQMTAAAQLQSLQRTPFGMVLARMKVLLERLHTLTQRDGNDGAGATETPSPASQQPQPQQQGLSSTGAGARPASRSMNFASVPASGRRGSSSSSSNSTPAAARGGAARSRLLEPSMNGATDTSGGKFTEQSLLDELSVMFGFCSEFLASLPDETRQQLARVGVLASFKKDQIIYDIGQAAENFYCIMAGSVQVWSHPPGAHRPKSVVSVLGRGEVFGDQALIAGAGRESRHSTAASPVCNATLLVVSKQDFLAVLGAHFQGVAAGLKAFLLGSVTPLADAPPAEMHRLCSALVSSRPAAGKEWRLLEEQQVFFIKAGTFELQLIDLEAQRAADAAASSAIAATSAATAMPASPSAASAGSLSGRSSAAPLSAAAAAAAAANASPEEQLLAAAAAAAAKASAVSSSACSSSDGGGCGFQQLMLTDLPAVSKQGPLANVRVLQGVGWLGTLGAEEQLRRSRQARVPRKVVAELSAGSWFGGGAAVLGGGPVQSALRVVAKSAPAVQLQIVPAAPTVSWCMLIPSISDAMLGRLRDDAAFKLTYHLGRLGILPPATAVGHPLSSLLQSGSVGSPRAAAAAMSGEARSARAAGGSSAGQAAASAASSAAANMQVGAAAAAADTDASNVRTSVAMSCCSAAMSGGGGTSPPDATAAAQLGLQAATANAASTLGASSGLKRRQRKYVHVAGSAVYSPGTMAALQHVKSLQGAGASGSHHARCSVLQAARPAGRPSTAPQASRLPADAAASSTRADPAAGSALPGSRPASGGSLRSSSIVANTRSSLGEAAAQLRGCRPGSAGSAAAPAGVTAAERYWRNPEHSCSATSAALSPLLNSLFDGGLAPLAASVDQLMAHAAARGCVVALDPSGCSPAARATVQQAQQRQHRQRPSSAFGRLQQGPERADGSGGGSRDERLRPGSAAPPSSLLRPKQFSSGSSSADPMQVLQHKPYSSLLAATVLWQRQAEHSFRPPLRQCLTTTEIDEQRCDDDEATGC